MFNSPGFLSITLIDHTWCMGAHCMYVKIFAVDPNRIREEIPEIVCGQHPLLFLSQERGVCLVVGGGLPNSEIAAVLRSWIWGLYS